MPIDPVDALGANVNRHPAPGCCRPVLIEYLRRFPEVDAQRLFLDWLVNVVEEGIDVAVRIGELPDSSLQATRVGRVRRVLVASPDYLSAHRPRTVVALSPAPPVP